MNGGKDALRAVAALQLPRRGDARGALVALESGRQVPFDIRRVYYIFDTPAGSARGHHAHRALWQYAVAVAGGVSVLMDDGHDRWQVRLDSPDRGLEIPPMVWHEMHDFSADCVLLVLASAAYDEADYIRERTEFDELTR